MAETLAVGSPPVLIQIRRRKSARHLTLRVAHGREGVFLTAPPGTPRPALEAFVTDRLDWLSERLAERPAPIEIAPGQSVPVLGTPHRLEPGAGRTVQRDGATLHVPGEGPRFRARLRAWLIEEARAALVSAVDRHAQSLGRPYREIRLRDTRSRWGSCSSDGRLLFSWRLVMTPPDVLNYVAAHEVAHLVEMNHSRRFWALVEGLDPGMDSSRRWLKSPAATALHRYQF